METPQIYTPATLAETLSPAVEFANGLAEQAERCVVDSQETLDKATDFLAICNAALKRADERRTGQVKPLNDHVKWLNDQWKTVTKVLEEAKVKVQARGTTWARAEQQRVREAQEAERKAFEEQALRDAEQAQAGGHEKLAAAIVDAAVATPVQAPAKAKSTGGFTGATSSLRQRWEGVVAAENIRTVCAAVASGVLPAEIITFSKTELNKLATTIAAERVHHGVTVIDATKLIAR